jgi:tyrosyl-tRNA synthetase
MDEVSVHAPEGTIGIGHVLKSVGLVSSTSEAMRQIRQGAVRVDGHKLDDTALTFTAGASHVIQVGKRRVARVRIAG